MCCCVPVPAKPYRVTVALSWSRPDENRLTLTGSGQDEDLDLVTLMTHMRCSGEAELLVRMTCRPGACDRSCCSKEQSAEAAVAADAAAARFAGAVMRTLPDPVEAPVTETFTRFERQVKSDASAQPWGGSSSVQPVKFLRGL